MKVVDMPQVGARYLVEVEVESVHLADGHLLVRIRVPGEVALSPGLRRKWAGPFVRDVFVDLDRLRPLA